MNNYDPWKIIPLSSTAIPAETFLRHLVAWAVLAPSSHNSQPWCFMINPRERRIAMRLDYVRVLKASDAREREAHVSLGCAAAYLTAATRAYGYNAELSYVSDAGTPLITAVIPRRPTMRERHALFNAMHSRRSNRSVYDPHKRIPDLLIERFNEFAASADVRFTPIVDRLTRHGLAGMLYAAERIVTSNDGFRKELGSYFLKNDDASCVGMPGNNFGLADADAALISEELKKDKALDKKLSHRLAVASYRGMQSAPMIGVVSIPKDIPRYWLKAGFAFGRMAIAAETSKVATAVNAAFVEAPPFNFALRLRLASSWRPTVVFRLGYTDEQRPHSPRISAADVTTLVD